MLYRINKKEMKPLQPTTFEQQGLKEREVQELLKNQINLIAPDTLIVAWEFADWKPVGAL